MSAGGISVLAIVVLAAFVLAATTISARIHRNHSQRTRERSAAAARARRAAQSAPSVQASDDVSTDLALDANDSQPAAPGVPLSLVGTDELAESMRQASLRSPTIRVVEGPFPKRWADRSRKRTAWAAGGSLGAGSAWGGNASGCGGGVNGNYGGGCGGGGCGGGGCGGGG